MKACYKEYFAQPLSLSLRPRLAASIITRSKEVILSNSVSKSGLSSSVLTDKVCKMRYEQEVENDRRLLKASGFPDKRRSLFVFADS